ncbi:MAG: hypothetical protein LBT62_01440 [Deltaproteobacteria bacterium]|jgi:mannose-6-phosphate isomerase class I|nr:hypothetical protein [Deltaproteobacteria bacterium]
MSAVNENFAEIAPLALTPIAADRIWGSTVHSTYSVPAKAEDVNWGEIWLACEDFSLNSVVSNGPFAGNALRFFKQRWGVDFCGYLSAEQKRVLPMSLRIERTGSEPGPVRVFSKEEFWYVLDVGVNSWVSFGTSLDDGPWPSRLSDKLNVEPGDRFLLPNGMVRAQGPNLTVLKVLQADAMVQTLYNWERKKEVWDFSPPAVDIPIEKEALIPLKTVLEGRNRLLYQGPSYSIKLIHTNFVSEVGEKLSLVCPIKGRAHLKVSGQPDNLRLVPGQVVVLPARLGRFSIESGTIISYILIQIA